MSKMSMMQTVLSPWNTVWEAYRTCGQWLTLNIAYKCYEFKAERRTWKLITVKLWYVCVVQPLYTKSESEKVKVQNRIFDIFLFFQQKQKTN